MLLLRTRDVQEFEDPRMNTATPAMRTRITPQALDNVIPPSVDAKRPLYLMKTVWRVRGPGKYTHNIDP